MTDQYVTAGELATWMNTGNAGGRHVSLGAEIGGLGRDSYPPQINPRRINTFSATDRWYH
jgi:hypothetical protein